MCASEAPFDRQDFPQADPGSPVFLVVALGPVAWMATKVAEAAYLETLTRDLADRGRMLAALGGDALATGLSGIF